MDIHGCNITPKAAIHSNHRARHARRGASVRARVLDLGAARGDTVQRHEIGVIGTGRHESVVHRAGKLQKNSALPTGLFIHGVRPASLTKRSMWRLVGAVDRRESRHDRLLARSRTPEDHPHRRGLRRQLPPGRGCRGCHPTLQTFSLPDLLASFGRRRFGIVEIVLTNGTAGTIEAAKWLTMRR